MTETGWVQEFGEYRWAPDGQYVYTIVRAGSKWVLSEFYSIRENESHKLLSETVRSLSAGQLKAKNYYRINNS